MKVEKKRDSVWTLDVGGRLAPGGSERRDAARNRRAILCAARELFAEKGVTAVTMEEISRAAGVGKGTLYRRFPHKGLLCQELLDEPTRRLQAETLRMQAEPGAPLEKLRAFLGMLAWFTEENLDLLYGGHEPLSGGDRLADYEHPAYGWRRWTVQSLLRAAVREGDLGAHTDTEYLADALLAPLHVDLFYHQRRVRGVSVERIAEGLVTLAPRNGS